MTLKEGITISTGIVSLIVTLLFVYSYFATAQDLQEFKSYSEYTFDELKLERVEDKINTIEVKSSESLEDWEKEKLLILKSQQERIIRRIQNNQ